MKFQKDDGGRSMAGYVGVASDCVARSVAIATGRPYREVYAELAELNANTAKTKRRRHGTLGKRTARNGIYTTTAAFKRYMVEQGFTWIPLNFIGLSQKVHMVAEQLPTEGTYILSLSKHYTTLIDGVIHDTYDPSRDGTRMVYGYWKAVARG